MQIPGEEDMIVRSVRFLDLETPPEFFTSWITPVPHFFVRNHMHEPSSSDADSWRLTISGEVEKPLTLSLADLAKLERHRVTNTLECAGNGRAFQRTSCSRHPVAKRSSRNRTFQRPPIARRSCNAPE